MDGIFRQRRMSQWCQKKFCLSWQQALRNLSRLAADCIGRRCIQTAQKYRSSGQLARLRRSQSLSLLHTQSRTLSQSSTLETFDSYVAILRAIYNSGRFIQTDPSVLMKPVCSCPPRCARSQSREHACIYIKIKPGISIALHMSKKKSQAAYIWPTSYSLQRSSLPVIVSATIILSTFGQNAQNTLTCRKSFTTKLNTHQTAETLPSTETALLIGEMQRLLWEHHVSTCNNYFDHNFISLTLFFITVTFTLYILSFSEFIFAFIMFYIIAMFFLHVAANTCHAKKTLKPLHMDETLLTRLLHTT